MKKFLVLIIGVLMSVVVFAHAPLISVDDNGDGTVYIEGGFSNGASAEGVEIIVVKDKAYNGPEETFKGNYCDVHKCLESLCGARKIFMAVKVDIC